MNRELVKEDLQMEMFVLQVIRKIQGKTRYFQPQHWLGKQTPEIDMGYCLQECGEISPFMGCELKEVVPQHPLNLKLHVILSPEIP